MVCEFVSWDDGIPDEYGKMKAMFQTTNQIGVLLYPFAPILFAHDHLKVAKCHARSMRGCLSTYHGHLQSWAQR